MATDTQVVSRDHWFVFSTDWAGYLALDRARNERPVPRIIYLNRSALLVSPGYQHELIAKRLAWVVEEVMLGFRIPGIPAGSTTFRRRSRRGGIEADESFYFANAPRVAGNVEIDLDVDPPPDLAIEAVVTHPVKRALEVYRRLRVPEVWVCDGRTLRILVLQPDHTYAEAPTSLALPMISAADALAWAQRPISDYVTARLEVRRWVEEELIPRVRGGGPV